MKRLLSFVLSAALIVSGTYAANSMHISADEASSGVGSSATPQTELDPASSPQITKEPGAVPDDTPQVSGQPTVKPDNAPQVSGQPTAKPGDVPQVSEQPTTVPGNTPQVSEQPTTVPSNTPQATVEPSATPQVTEVTAPIAPQVTQIKGGSKRVKLYWTEQKDASGYYIYYATSKTGTYTRTKTITNPGTCKYVKKSLEQNKTYYFKISAYTLNANGLPVEGELSQAYAAKTITVSATSKGARKYSSIAKFKKSPAYKKYAFLRKANYTKSFAIPGMKTTNVAGFANNRMFPQGGCTAGAYMLVSAYAYNGEDESVIYVLSRSSKSYITTLVMPNKTKINAMAYDGKNVWLTQGKKVVRFSYEMISKAVASGNSYTELAAFDETYSIATNGSYMAYRDHVLWIGAYNSKLATRMYGYVVQTGTTGAVSLTRKYYMAMPNRTRAVSFDANGYMYVVRSSQSNNKQSGYLSQIRTYKPAFSTPAASGGVAKKAYTKKTTIPPRACGSMVYGQYLYTVFSGCKYSKCTYKVDRVIAIKLTSMR